MIINVIGEVSRKSILLEDDEEIKICGNLRWIVDDDFSFVRVNFKYYILL